MKALSTLTLAGILLFVGAGVAHAAPPAAPNSGVSENLSRNWSGYVADSGTYTSITGTWNVPNVTPSTDATADATWVGIGGVTGTDLIQAGTQEISENGQVQYQAWYETLPNASTVVPLSVDPGDSVTATLTNESNDNWLVTIIDNTTGQQYSTTVSYNSSLSSAEWIEEMPSDQNDNFIPLDSFGTVSFTNAQATVNGVNESLVENGSHSLAITNGSQLLATPSAIGSDGESFTVTRSSASADVAPQTIVIQRGKNWRGGRGAQGFSQASSTQSTQSATQTFSLSPGQTFRIIRYFSFPGFDNSGTTTEQSNVQTFSFPNGNGSFTVQFSI